VRGLIGALIFALIIVLMHDAANSEARLHCVPVTVPPPVHCEMQMGQPLKRPLECNRA
jgi:hypothetical protein